MSKKESDWLKTLRDDLACITGEAAKQFWPSPEKDCPAFFNYRLEHVKQAERDAMRLLSAVGGDRDIVLASVWIHDRFQPVFIGEEHGKQAAKWAAEHLTEIGFPAEKVESVCFAVANHSNPPGTIPPEAHEARVLWDADKLTRLGAVRLLFTFFIWYVASDRLRALCSDSVFPEHTLTTESMASMSLQRYWMSLQRHWKGEFPPSLFYFKPSRRWAAERWELQEAFYESLRRQVEEHPCAA